MIQFVFILMENTQMSYGSPEVSSKVRIKIMWRKTNQVTFSGCNLSPLLFSIFINDLGSKLNSSGLGINLATHNISSIFFADDLVLIGRTKAALDTLMEITRDFFTNHKLEISEKKSKIFNHDCATGKTTFQSSHLQTPLHLENVMAFKYLGFPLNCSPHNFLKDFNEQVKRRAQNYLVSVLSLVRSGPDRSALAYTLWCRCALPSILYGTEIMPLTQATISEVEKCQHAVGRFILQLPRGSANCSSFLDAGLKPVWSHIAEKVILYSQSLMSRPSSYWAKIAMDENLTLGNKSPYTRYLLKWKTATDCFGLPPKQIRAAVKRSAILDVFRQQRQTSTSCFAMNEPASSSSNSWFRPKLWVTDSSSSKIIAQFRSCNLQLGNRGPAKNGQFYKLCPLCTRAGTSALNNEVIINYKNCVYSFLYF